jgi:hypothetical protein
MGASSISTKKRIAPNRLTQLLTGAQYDSPMSLSAFDRIDIVVFSLCPPITALDSISSSERHQLARGKEFPSPLPLVTVT